MKAFIILATISCSIWMQNNPSVVQCAELEEDVDNMTEAEYKNYLMR